MCAVPFWGGSAGCHARHCVAPRGKARVTCGRMCYGSVCYGSLRCVRVLSLVPEQRHRSFPAWLHGAERLPGRLELTRLVPGREKDLLS